MASLSLQEIIACIGYPVAGNPTQYVMERAFEAAGVDSRCLTLDVPPDELPAAIQGMVSMGFRGAILADPHRSTAGEHLNRLSREASMLGETDLIYRDGDQLVGDNTMVLAATEVLAKKIDVAGKQAVVVGCGQAARAIALSLALAGAQKITLFAQDDMAAEAICELIQQNTSCQAVVQPWLDPYRLPAGTRVVVQARRSDEHDAADRGGGDFPLDPNSLAADMVLLDTDYHSPHCDFLRLGQSAGCATINGLDLLVQRASAAFQTWTTVKPDLAIVREAFEEFLMI